MNDILSILMSQLLSLVSYPSVLYQYLRCLGVQPLVVEETILEDVLHPDNGQRGVNAQMH
jgi:hypothetical protein